MRHLSVSSLIRVPSTYLTAGIWAVANKDGDNLDCGSSLLMPTWMCPNFRRRITAIPPRPYAWTTYNFEITMEEDPTEVLIGLYVTSAHAWFDDIRLEVNGVLIDDFMFQITEQ